ncbi:proline dehydrogenase [Salinarchaeum sp. Harcht-Bsk1]|uniref:proline dehydrogenase family protein n=1 Tax=Salinarchaeum sp. Harcht-Bsk1 TaxID=1333523 RepID=UPI00034244FC|nr:proline dehydrogenase family protein [Salinarchaeum sp. Harcht-Bsk1]AGN01424.1 proline dehydrogenase [Salinarchaeum sp. Harcht-Bsk1]
MIPPIASRFVGGETPAEAVDTAWDLQDRQVGAILNLLGEHYTDPEDAAGDRDAYRDLLADIEDPELRACVSVKPSQLGLDVGADTFRENARLVVEAAAEHDGFVWFDMEDHETTDVTLDAVEAFATDGHDVGVCMQANLRRTEADVERFADVPAKVRLVKGAYDEPEAIAYTDRAAVNDAYRDLLTQAFETYDGGVAVGSHDEQMIEHAIECHEATGTDFEFQFLAGVREDRLFDLAETYECWQYVPYGGKWFSYFSRRVLERKENALFALRAILNR